MDRQELRENVRMVLPPEITDISDARINALLDQGINEIATQFTWPWLEETALVSLVASTRTAALPADYLFGAVLVDDDNDEELPYIAALEFFRRTGNDTGNTGTDPEFYTIYEGNFYFSPIPSANDTSRYTLYYYEDPTLLTTDSTEPQFNAAFHWILVEYAKWKLYERESMTEQAERSKLSYFTYLDNMRAWYGRTVQRAPFISGDGWGRTLLRDRNIPSLNSGF